MAKNNSKDMVEIDGKAYYVNQNKPDSFISSINDLSLKFSVVKNHLSIINKTNDKITDLLTNNESLEKIFLLEDKKNDYVLQYKEALKGLNDFCIALLKFFLNEKADKVIANKDGFDLLEIVIECGCKNKHTASVFMKMKAEFNKADA